MLCMNEQKWEQTVDEIGPKLYRYFKYKGAADLASDLTQEVFLRLIEAENRYDRDKGALLSFAYGIANNVWRESARKHREHADVAKLEIPAEHDLAGGRQCQ